MDRSEWTVTVSSELADSYLKSNLLDGKADTYWHTRRDATMPLPHSVAVDFGSEKELAGFRLLPRAAEQNLNNRAQLKDWQLHVSDDGVEWSEPVATGQFAHDHATKDFILPEKIAARHMRITLITGWGEPAPYALQIAELNAFERVATPPTSPTELRIILQSSTDLSNWTDIHTMLVARKDNPFFPRLRSAPGSSNGLHPKSNFLAMNP